MAPLLLLLLGCWEDRREALREEEVLDEMIEHWASGETARDAVIEGDLDAAKEAGRELAERLPIDNLETLEAVQAELKAHATTLAAAKDIDAAGLAVGRMAATCGRCHQANRVEIGLSAPEPPKAGDGLDRQMELHQYAATKMWFGVVEPSEDKAKAAAKALTDNPMVPSGLQADSPVPPVATELEVRVHDLASKAARASDPTAIGEAYGKMLGTCAACHDLLKSE